MALLPYSDFEKDFFKFPNFPSFDLDIPRGIPRFFEMSPVDRERWFDSLFKDFRGLSIQDPSARIVTDDNKFQMNVDVQHFAPEDIVVKVKDNSVIIEAKHEEQRDRHGFISRQFARRYTLPEGCLPSMVESTLSTDGVLTVTCPRRLALPSHGEKIIPVRHTGPISRRFY